MYQKKRNPLDSLFLSEEVKLKKEQDSQRLHMKNTMCNKCENNRFCSGGIIGCGSFRMKEIFRRTM
jgi:radical SAM protein with 4Fe4S-binding SPASM domain